MQGEKDALARALDQLQVAGVGRTHGGGAQGLREVILSLEEQLLRERTRNQRSASKRSQEKRLLMEEVLYGAFLLMILLLALSAYALI